MPGPGTEYGLLNDAGGTSITSRSLFCCRQQEIHRIALCNKLHALKTGGRFVSLLVSRKIHSCQRSGLGLEVSGKTKVQCLGTGKSRGTAGCRRKCSERTDAWFFCILPLGKVGCKNYFGLFGSALVASGWIGISRLVASDGGKRDSPVVRRPETASGKTEN